MEKEGVAEDALGPSGHSNSIKASPTIRLVMRYSISDGMLGRAIALNVDRDGS